MCLQLSENADPEEIKFKTIGLVPGLVISCVSVVALVGYTIFDKKRKQKNIPVTPEVTA